MVPPVSGQAQYAASRTQGFIDRLRSEIRTLPLYPAGLSAEFVRSKYNVQEVAKLGSNENPYGASPVVLAALTAAVPDVPLYPDPNCMDLRSALSNFLSIAPDRLAFGDGSEDLIRIASLTFLAPGDEVVTMTPAFALHITCPQSIGAHVHAVRVHEDYSPDIDAVIEALTPRTRMLMFGNPSNPVGSSITEQDMHRLIAAVPQDAILVFDEAYYEYAAAERTYPAFLPMLEKSRVPWVVLRTFSKAYALAGLRVGYAIASEPSLIGLLDRVRGPFNVNRLAQVAAVAALKDIPYMEDCVRRTIAERERMRLALERMEYRPSPSLTNFLFFNANENAAELAKRLLTKGVIVKPWGEPGYREHVRVSIGSPQSNDQFISALAQARS